MLAYIHNKRLRRIFEASAISINNQPGFFGKTNLQLINFYSYYHNIPINPYTLISCLLSFSSSLCPVNILSIYFCYFHLKLHLPFSHNYCFSTLKFFLFIDISFDIGLIIYLTIVSYLHMIY